MCAIRGLTTTTLILALAASAAADVLTTTSGRKVTGDVVTEDANSVTFEIRSPGMNMREIFKREDIASITKPQVVNGPSYFEIPIMGAIGPEVTAKALSHALDAARNAKAGHVVLLFDSPGGMLTECDQIIEVMDQNRDLKTIAYVKNALSAASVIAVTCNTIIMHPTGEIGAAVPYRATADGTPVEVNEKVTSAFRARARTAAAIGGHDPELLMGMIDIQMELYLRRDANGITISERRGPDAMLIKPRNKILTLTAEEATKYGLAKAIARGMSEVGKEMGLAQWTACGRDGWDIMKSSAAAQRATFTQAAQEVQTRQDENAEHVSDFIKGRMREAQSQIDKCDEDLKALEREFKELTRQMPLNNAIYKACERRYQDARAKVQEAKAAWQSALESCKKLSRQLDK